MALFPALAMATLLAWGPARAAPMTSTDTTPAVMPPAPAPQPPPPHKVSLGGDADNGVVSWEHDVHRGRREAADFTTWEPPVLCGVASGRTNRIEPLYAEEPRFVLLERRETSGGGVGAATPGANFYDANDPFWVARGRRRDGSSSGSSFEEPFWPARGRRLWSLRGALADASVEEPFWAARGRRGSERGLARAQRSGASADPMSPRWRRRQVESLEDPFWAPRGRRGARDSLSVEEPFWATRGKKGVQAFQDLLSKVRARGASAELDPFWAARGKRGGAGEDAEENADDELFWSALERRSALSGR